MPLEAALPGAAERAAELNARYRHHGATAVMDHALRDPQVGSIALVSSFGAESVVLLHMLARADRTVPVVLIDTRLLFPETLDYQRMLAAKLGLADIRVIRPAADTLAARDPDDTLHRRDPDACCQLRKVETLEHTLEHFDAWITGRKRFHGGARAALDFFEADTNGRIKVNPLAHWEKCDVQDYIVNNRLPRHPLVADGYASIGCQPCTRPVAPDEGDRAGRWAGLAKAECGIHLETGQTVRAG